MTKERQNGRNRVAYNSVSNQHRNHFTKTPFKTEDRNYAGCRKSRCKSPDRQELNERNMNVFEHWVLDLHDTIVDLIG